MMNPITLIALMILVAFALFVTLFRITRPRFDGIAGNIAGGEHGSLSKRATAAIATRHLLVKFGATADLITPAGAADQPLGPVPDEAEEANDVVQVELLGICPKTLTMVASEAITAGEDVFAAAGGKVQDLPAGAGTYYKVGRALTAAGGDGEELEVAHCHPIPVVVT